MTHDPAYSKTLLIQKECNCSNSLCRVWLNSFPLRSITRWQVTTDCGRRARHDSNKLQAIKYYDDGIMEIF